MMIPIRTMNALVNGLYHSDFGGWMYDDGECLYSLHLGYGFSIECETSEDGSEDEYFLSSCEYNEDRANYQYMGPFDTNVIDDGYVTIIKTSIAGRLILRFRYEEYDVAANKEMVMPVGAEDAGLPEDVHDRSIHSDMIENVLFRYVEKGDVSGIGPFIEYGKKDYRYSMEILPGHVLTFFSESEKINPKRLRHIFTWKSIDGDAELTEEFGLQPHKWYVF